MAGVGHIWSYSTSRLWWRHFPGDRWTLHYKEALKGTWAFLVWHCSVWWGNNGSKMCRKSYLHGVVYQSCGTERTVLCNRMSFSRTMLFFFFCQKRTGAKLQRQTLLSSGDRVYKHKDNEAFKGFSTRKIQPSKKKNKWRNKALFWWRSTDASSIS